MFSCYMRVVPVHLFGMDLPPVVPNGSRDDVIRYVLFCPLCDLPHPIVTGKHAYNN